MPRRVLAHADYSKREVHNSADLISVILHGDNSLAA